MQLTAQEGAPGASTGTAGAPAPGAPGPYESLLQAASCGVHAPLAGLTVVHGGRHSLQCQLGLGRSLEAGAGLAPGSGLCAAVVASGAPLRLDDVAGLAGAADDPLVAAGGVRAYLGVPLGPGPDGAPAGSLFVAERQPRRWTDADVALLGALGRVATRRVELALELERQRRARALATGQQHVLELLATGRPLPDVLDAIVRLLESQSPDRLCSVQLLEEGGAWLRQVAAPSLPAGYLALTARIPVGPAHGSCGTAVHRRARVVVEDIGADPLWREVRELALGHGLRSCWSQPFFGAQGEVLGTCAVYRRTPAAAQPQDVELLEVAARLAGIAVEHARTAERLARSEAHYRRLVDSSPHPIYTLDVRGHLVEFNPAMASVLGRSMEELRGRHFAELAAPASHASASGAFTELLRGQHPSLSFRAEAQRPDGERRLLAITASPIRSAGGVAGVHGIVHDVTELVEKERALEEERQRLEQRLRIETAIAHLSARLASGAPGAVDEALRSVGEVMGVAHVGLTRQCDEGGRTRMTHEWCGPGTPPNAARWNAAGRPLFGWLLGRLQRGEAVALDDVRALPPEAHAERAYLDSEGVRAHLAVPLVDGQGRLFGFMGLADTRGPRTWPDEDLRLLRTAADMLSAHFSRERMLRELQHSEQRYRELVELSPDAILIHAGGQVTFANRMALRLFRARRAGDVVGRPILSFLHPAHHAQLEARVEHMLESGEPAPFIEYRVRRVDGTEFDGLIASAPYRHEGRPAIQVVFHDLTERRHAEEALRTVFDSVSDAIFIHEVDGTLIDVNQRMLEVFGVTREEALRLSILEDLSGADNAVEGLRARWQRALGGERQHFPWNARRPSDGSTFSAEVFLTRISYAGRDVLLATVRDVTEQQRLEGQLMQAQKMEAVGRLAGGVAHDFNNLLTVIHCHAGFLQADLPERHPLQEDVQQVMAAAERASGLTRQLLAFSRRQMLRPKAVDLNAVVADLEKMLRRLIGEDIALSTTPGTDLARVLADPGQMEQVLMNLVVNARDAMPGGGTLCIATANVVLQEGSPGRPAYVEPGEYVEVSVQDSGCGIPADVLPRIFEPFFTTKAVGRGTGLGLATVYGIVKQSNGYVWAESEPGAGTTFRVLLPQAPLVAGEDAAGAARPSAGGSEVVLLVEDEAGVRRLTRKVLERRGYQVLEAAGGDEALAAMRRHAGPIHLLLTDVVMPGMSGSLVAECVRERHPDVRVLFMSGYNDDEVVRKGVLTDESGLLEKPFTPDILARRVREALGPRPA